MDNVVRLCIGWCDEARTAYGVVPGHGDAWQVTERITDEVGECFDIVVADVDLTTDRVVRWHLLASTHTPDAVSRTGTVHLRHDGRLLAVAVPRGPFPWPCSASDGAPVEVKPSEQPQPDLYSPPTYLWSRE